MVTLLADLKLTFTVSSSPEGKLYGSITNKDIAEKILEERKVDIDKKKIELAEHIKEVGEYDVEVKLYKDVKAEIKIVVVSEDIVVENKDQSTEEGQSNDNIDPESK